MEVGNRHAPLAGIAGHHSSTSMARSMAFTTADPDP